MTFHPLIPGCIEMIKGMAKIANKKLARIFCQFVSGRTKTNIPLKANQPPIIKISTRPEISSDY